MRPILTGISFVILVLVAVALLFAFSHRSLVLAQETRVREPKIEFVQRDGTRADFGSTTEMETYIKSKIPLGADMDLMVYPYEKDGKPGVVILGGGREDLAEVRILAKRPLREARPTVKREVSEKVQTEALDRIRRASEAGEQLRAAEVERLMEAFNEASASGSRPELSQKAVKLMHDLAKFTKRK